MDMDLIDHIITLGFGLMLGLVLFTSYKFLQNKFLLKQKKEK